MSESRPESLHPESTITAASAAQDRVPIITLLATTLLSTLSNNLAGLAIPWFILSLTGSVEKMGIVAAATMVPQALMAMFGGTIADRMSPRRLSMGADTLSALSVAMIPLLHSQGHLSFGMLLALCVAGAVFDGPGYAGRGKLTPVLAERGNVSLERVNSVTGMTHAMSMILGTLLGGVLIGFMGASNVLWINAATFLISVLGMMAFIPEVHAPRETDTSFTEDLREGIAFIRKLPLLTFAIPMALVLNMMVTPVLAVLIPYFAKSVWGSPERYGIIMSGFGFGVLGGSLAFGWLGQRFRPSLLLRTSMVLFTIPLWVLVSLPSWQLTWVSALIIGAAAGVLNPLFSTLVMKATPHELLGRVNGVVGAGAMIAAPVGVLLASPMVAKFGLGPAFAIFAAGALIMPLAAMVVNLPALADHLTGPQAADITTGSEATANS